MKSKNNGGLFGGVIAGIAMLVVGTGLLWWNEGNNVKNIKTEKEVAENVIDIKSDTVDAKYDGKLVATSGSLVVEDEFLEDAVFAVKIHSAALKRNVEIYEWEEDEDNSSDTTTYNYKKGWHNELIDSSNFYEKNHENPTTVPYESVLKLAEKVKLGAYTLSKSQIEQLITEEYITLENISLDGYKVVGNYLTNAEDINNPKVGDIRISFLYNNWDVASVLAKVSNDTFVPYVSKVEKEVNILSKGTLTSAEFLTNMKNENKVMKWVFRLIGSLVIIFGYLAIISPITKIASYVPILGGLVNSAIGLVVFLIGLVHSMLVIALAWIRFRPILGLSLLAICALIIYYLLTLKKKKANEQAAI